MIPEVAPGDLAERLAGHGLVPADGPGWEPHATSMALVAEPSAAPSGVEVRRYPEDPAARAAS